MTKYFPILLMFALPAMAQDVPLDKVAGVYNAGCLDDPINTDVVEGCFVRVDASPVIELGCTTDVSTRADDVAAGKVYRMDFQVQQTTFDDAEIRCYVNDSVPQSSLYSDNAGLIDFTPPAKGRVIAWCTEVIPKFVLETRSYNVRAS
jgi:hypothetical protein